MMSLSFEVFTWLFSRLGLMRVNRWRDGRCRCASPGRGHGVPHLSAGGLDCRRDHSSSQGFRRPGGWRSGTMSRSPVLLRL